MCACGVMFCARCFFSCGVFFFFFFKQKTAYEMCGRDWSSDVCSSDLTVIAETLPGSEGESAHQVQL